MNEKSSQSLNSQTKALVVKNAWRKLEVGGVGLLTTSVFCFFSQEEMNKNYTVPIFTKNILLFLLLLILKRR